MRRRLGSVGRPLPMPELESRDPDRQLSGTGKSGEIPVRVTGADGEGSVGLSATGVSTASAMGGVSPGAGSSIGLR